MVAGCCGGRVNDVTAKYSLFSLLFRPLSTLCHVVNHRRDVSPSSSQFESTLRLVSMHKNVEKALKSGFTHD